MQMTDHILFVKETKTCSYVLVVHTPRLCGEPGFKSRHDVGGEAEIRCRAIVNNNPSSPLDLPTADHPVDYPLRKTYLPAPPKSEKGSESGDQSSNRDKAFNELLRKTLEALVGPDGLAAEGEGDFFLDVADDANDVDGDRLVEALRAAGFNVEAEVVKVRPDKDGKRDDRKQDKKKKEPGSRADPRRDEL